MAYTLFRTHGLHLTFPPKTGPVETSEPGYYIVPEEDWT
jgi:hypothetical protein